MFGHIASSHTVCNFFSETILLSSLYLLEFCDFTLSQVGFLSIGMYLFGFGFMPFFIATTPFSLIVLVGIKFSITLLENNALLAYSPNLV